MINDTIKSIFKIQSGFMKHLKKTKKQIHSNPNGFKTEGQEWGLAPRRHLRGRQSAEHSWFSFSHMLSVCLCFLGHFLHCLFFHSPFFQWHSPSNFNLHIDTLWPPQLITITSHHWLVLWQRALIGLILLKPVTEVKTQHAVSGLVTFG